MEAVVKRVADNETKLLAVTVAGIICVAPPIRRRLGATLYS